MNTKKKIFEKLLSIIDIHNLYKRIGSSLIKKTDLKDLPYDQKSLSNSLELLQTLDFIKINKTKILKKEKNSITSQNNFKKIFKFKLFDKYKIEIRKIFDLNIEFDEEKSVYRLNRNSVELSLSGLIFLLEGLNLIKTDSLYIYFSDVSLVEHLDNKNKTKTEMSIVELKNSLILKEQLGEEAEKIAFDYEINLLKELKINKEVKLVSQFDVSLGYDIVSYLDNETDKPNKFIEVKSCADDNFRFYISRNEIDVAKLKGERYFLYLYNRKYKNIKIIKNPYKNIFTNKEWIKSSKIFEIYYIG